MPFLSGENITAQRLNRLQPKSYWAQASGTVAASSSSVDVPGATATFSTEVAGATAIISWQAAFYFTGVAGGLASVAPLIDGVTVSPNVALARQQASLDQIQGASSWQTTLAAAGSHTIKLRANTGTNTVVQIYTALQVMILEVA